MNQSQTDADAHHQAEQPEAVVSAWSPLRNHVFRAILIATIVSNIAFWLQNVAASWLMTSLTPSPLLVALMQTAASLPIFLVGLLAGALADVMDRRKLLLATMAWTLLVALALGILTLLDLTSAWMLLGLTFLLGLGGALNTPAWLAVISELVPPKELTSAVTLHATGFNLARAIGPALAGIMVAVLGPAAVFLLNAALFLYTIVVLIRWQSTRPPSSTPTEDMFEAITAGLRYMRHAPALQAVLIRSAIFALGSSGLMALLPVIARQELNLQATGFGLLMGSIGFGAVLGSFILPRLRRSLSIDRLAAAATLVFAGATLALAYLRSLPLLFVCMMTGGFAWLAMLSSLTVVTQTASPGWARARQLGLFLLVMQGVTAAGSFLWGALAEQFGNAIALLAAALTLVGGLAAVLRWPLSLAQRIDLSYSYHWPDPSIVLTPEPDDGPVLITVEYRVPADRQPAYLQAMKAMRGFRRREGAVRWDLFRDMADPERFVESFMVMTWGEHMRQHTRVTREDEATETYAFSFLKEGVAPLATHYIAAQAQERQKSAEPLYTQIT
jgi:MFS family permease